MNCCSKDALVRKLSAVSKMKRGTSITKKDIVEGNIPVISGGQAPAYYCNKSNRTEDVITIAGSGAYAGFVQYWNKPIFVCDAFSVQGIDGVTNTKYLYYVLQGMQNKIFATKKGSGVPHVHISCIENFEIPIPPLAVQEEIVRILDKFTELEAELEAELEKEQEARKKQYEWYRDRLLSFDDSVPQMAIEDICEINRGIVISKNYINAHTGKYPVFSSQTERNGILGLIDTFAYDGEYLTWTTDGANAGTIFHRIGKFNITNVCGLLKVKDACVDIRYLYHILTATAGKYVSKGMGNAKLMSNVMAKIRVSTPSIEEQRRIVSILDRLDALCNDINTGLPAEIAARRKQYEYYRDKLLSFEEVA